MYRLFPREMPVVQRFSVEVFSRCRWPEPRLRNIFGCILQLPCPLKGRTMKSIRSWDDLSAYGIVPLTGEACGLSYRILCDVTARGKKTLEKALSVAQLGLQENWNHGTDSDPHVGSSVA
jgi:hypothetical protein